MYGAGVGDLFVIVKPVSLSLDELKTNHKELIKFQKYGNQNNIWNEAHFNIEELDEDFQILFVANSGRGQLSDIAVDDVKLLTGDDCKALDNKEDEDLSNEEYDSTTYESIFEMQSCVGRCFDSPGTGIIRTSGHLKGLCNCDTDCEDSETCCPDFRILCLNELFDQATVYSVADETTQKNEAKIYNIDTTQATTTSTTRKSTPSTTTNTTPTTIKTTPATVKITSTTIKTTPTTTIQSTSTTTTSTTPKPKIVVTTRTTPKTTTTRKTTPTTTTRKTTPTTTTRKTTPSTTRTTRRTTTSTTTSRTTTLRTTTTSTTPNTTTTHATSTAAAKNSQAATSTQKPIPASKPIEYIISDKSKADKATKGFNLLLFTFVVIGIIILAGAAYRSFGDRAIAWYMIRFKQSNSGDEDSSSITTSFKRPQANGSNIDTNSKSNWRTKTKKSTSSKNSMKTPLVNDDDEDDDDMGANGNIALKNNIYTEL